jgi:glycosyltransferase involved in cell wall biosynthesis
MNDAAQAVHLTPGACKLSVMLKAFNQEPFIAQAIESALAQRTSFPVEIVIGEDCSTDHTGEIVARYATKYPSQIRVLAHARNLGMTRNTMVLYEECRGEYIAWLDGDDYWTSPDKLQRQVDFLDANPGHTLCFHDTLIVKPDGTAARNVCDWPAEGGVEDILFRGRGTSSSCVYRKVLDGFPEWFPALPYSDWALQVLHAEKGKVAWLPEMYGVHRAGGASLAALATGITGDLSDGEIWGLRKAEVLGILNRHLDFRYADQIAVEMLKTGPASSSLRAVIPSSRLRTAAWQAVRTRPRLARSALASANALARLVLWLRARCKRSTAG